MSKYRLKSDNNSNLNKSLNSLATKYKDVCLNHKIFLEFCDHINILRLNETLGLRSCVDIFELMVPGSYSDNDIIKLSHDGSIDNSCDTSTDKVTNRHLSVAYILNDNTQLDSVRIISFETCYGEFYSIYSCNYNHYDYSETLLSTPLKLRCTKFYIDISNISFYVDFINKLREKFTLDTLSVLIDVIDSLNIIISHYYSLYKSVNIYPFLDCLYHHCYNQKKSIINIGSSLKYVNKRMYELYVNHNNMLDVIEFNTIKEQVDIIIPKIIEIIELLAPTIKVTDMDILRACNILTQLRENNDLYVLILSTMRAASMLDKIMPHLSCLLYYSYNSLNTIHNIENKIRSATYHGSSMVWNAIMSVLDISTCNIFDYCIYKVYKNKYLRNEYISDVLFHTTSRIDNLIFSDDKLESLLFTHKHTYFGNMSVYHYYTYISYLCDLLSSVANDNYEDSAISYDARYIVIKSLAKTIALYDQLYGGFNSNDPKSTKSLVKIISDKLHTNHSNNPKFISLALGEIYYKL